VTGLVQIGFLGHQEDDISSASTAPFGNYLTYLLIVVITLL